VLSHKGAGWGFGVEKVSNIGVGLAASGSFDSGAHGEAVSTFAQDDRVWVGCRRGCGLGILIPTHADDEAVVMDATPVSKDSSPGTPDGAPERYG